MRFRFQFRRYRLPFRTTVRTARGFWTEREGLIVRLEEVSEGSSGAVGWGEAAPLPAFGMETVEEDESAAQALGEWIEASGNEALIERVPARCAGLRNALAAACAEIGSGSEPSSEAASQNARVIPDAPSGGPLSSQHPREIKGNPAYLAIAALLPAGRAALAAIEPRAEMGFRVFKWKVGVGDVADEIGLLDDLCAALPRGAKLRLDANGAWDRRRAERWLERCAERPIDFVEQPIAADARGAEDLLLGLAGDYPTALALDESLVGEGDIERWIGAGWPGIFVVKPSLIADVRSALGRLEHAKAKVVFSSALETAVGARAALRAAFAWRGEPDSTGSPQPRALGFGVWPLFADARFDGPAAAPFVRIEDVERINPEAIWTALN